jgi:hypothetical protein
MDFKTYFVKKIMMSFFVSVTCISAAMALIGMMYESDTRFGYEAFLSPLIFGAVASLPLLVKYSRNELTVKETVIRNVIHFILIEVLVLSVLYFGGMLTTVPVTVAIGFSILLIDLTVNLVLWVNDKKIAKEFNEALKIMQSMDHY